jgi:hypothetical protein
MIMLREHWQKVAILKRGCWLLEPLLVYFDPARLWHFPLCDSHVTGLEKISDEMTVSPALDKIINRSFFTDSSCPARFIFF